MAGSLPQLLHHRDELTTILCQTLEDPQAFYAWEPVLDLVPRLAADLSSSFLPVYPALLRAVLRRTSTTATLCGGDDQIAAAIVEQAFACAAWCFKALAPLIVRGGDEDGDRDEDFEVGEGEGRKRKRKLGKEAQQDEEDYLLATWEMIRLYVGWVPAGQTQAARHAEVDRAAVGEMEDALEAEVTNELDKAESAASDDEDAPEPSSRGSARTAKIPPHVRRFAAEAFAFLVRKARGAQLARISTAMLSDVAALTSTGSRSLQIGEGVAGVVTEAVKSVDHRVHSRAPVLLAAFLNAAPHSENATVSLSDFAFARERTVRRVLTALVHHTQTSHFAPVLELVANLVRERADTLEQQKDRQAAVEDVREALREAVEWLAACVGTRKGTRVSGE